jgi:hypothetical protein
MGEFMPTPVEVGVAAILTLAGACIGDVNGGGCMAPGLGEPVTPPAATEAALITGVAIVPF